MSLFGKKTSAPPPPPPKEEKPKRGVIGSKNKQNEEAMRAAGMKNGGMVKSKATAFKPCASCKMAPRCASVGKCLAKGK